MPSNEIFGAYSFPADDPRFRFASLKAFVDFLNQRERTLGEIVQAVGVYTPPNNPTEVLGNFYNYTPVEIREKGPAQPLEIFDVGQSYAQWIDRLVDTHELVSHSVVFVNGGQVEVALVRALESPPQRVAGGSLTTGDPRWNWLSPLTRIEGDDFVVSGVLCTWFGGPHDHQDTGETASGRVNTRRQPDFRGCALPMNGFRRSKNTLGSPIPRFRWMTPVTVECRDNDLKGSRITVELIDLGPAVATKHGIDLTEPAFNALGAASSRGVITVNYRIANWRDHLEPGATFTIIPASSSEQKPTEPEAGGNVVKVRATPRFDGSFEVDAFRAFVGSLRLIHLTADELLPYFANLRSGVSNAPPPPALWQNFGPTLLIVDAVRTRLGAPLHLTSSYRAPAYNRQLEGAAALSQHMAFRAADIQLAGIEPRAVHAALCAMRGTRLRIPAGAQFNAAGMVNGGSGINPATPFSVSGLQIQNPTAAADGSFTFAGGLGLYPTFVHVDCRGLQADW